MFIFSVASLGFLVCRVVNKTLNNLRVFSHRNQTMADAFLYSFVSIASSTLIESVSYKIIRNLFHFDRDTSQFRDRKDNPTEIPLDLNRSFENNHITA